MQESMSSSRYLLSNQVIKILIACLIPFLVYLLPTEIFFSGHMSVSQHRVLCIFILATLLWVMEPIPVFATSILIISLELISISNAGLSSLIQDLNPTELIPYQDIMNAFSSPIIVLFLGGFSLAIAASKYALDNNLARVLLKPFGVTPKYLMLGFMLITAVFSMFMSNTATTVMMLSILAPVIAYLPENDGTKKAFVLAIPVAANTGGMATPIGTPPNAIALGYLEGAHSIDFLTWMAFGLPFVMIQLFLGWVIVRKLFHVNPAPIKLQLSGEFEKSFKAKLVYFTFGLTILLWLTTALHGMNSYVIAVIPVAVFTIAGIIGKEELKQINWDVLFLVAGGIAIGHALDVTGLADLIAHAIDYNRLSSFGVIAALCVLCWLMANFMSNTATANLIIPIALAISTSMQSLSETYGIQGVLVMVAFAASLGMVLPISTPPNSLAYSTGFITTKDMAKVGVILGVIGLGLIFIASTLI